MYENIFSISHPIPPAGVSVFCLTVAGCAHIAYCTSSLVFGCAMMGVIERKGGMKINKCVFFFIASTFADAENDDVAPAARLPLEYMKIFICECVIAKRKCIY